MLAQNLIRLALWSSSSNRRVISDRELFDQMADIEEGQRFALHAFEHTVVKRPIQADRLFFEAPPKFFSKRYDDLLRATRALDTTCVHDWKRDLKTLKPAANEVCVVLGMLGKITLTYFFLQKEWFCSGFMAMVERLERVMDAVLA